MAAWNVYFKCTHSTDLHVKPVASGPGQRVSPKDLGVLCSVVLPAVEIRSPLQTVPLNFGQTVLSVQKAAKASEFLVSARRFRPFDKHRRKAC